MRRFLRERALYLKEVAEKAGSLDEHEKVDFSEGVL